MQHLTPQMLGNNTIHQKSQIETNLLFNAKFRTQLGTLTFSTHKFHSAPLNSSAYKWWTLLRIGLPRELREVFLKWI